MFFNMCWYLQQFPARLKAARLVLVQKGHHKPVEKRSSFQLLCLLGTTGKILERLFLEKLEHHLNRVGQRFEKQHGFRQRHSIMDAINRVIDTEKGVAMMQCNTEISAVLSHWMYGMFLTRPHGCFVLTTFSTVGNLHMIYTHC
jgi:hypothetical protein